MGAPAAALENICTEPSGSQFSGLYRDGKLKSWAVSSKFVAFTHSERITAFLRSIHSKDSRQARGGVGDQVSARLLKHAQAPPACA
jgi:hypothetical protein